MTGNQEATRNSNRKLSSDTQGASTDPAVVDPRFKAASWDPRFSRVPKKAKIAIADDRFSNILKQDPGFREKQTLVDRFGRPKKRPKLDYTTKEIAADDENDREEQSSDEDEREGPVPSDEELDYTEHPSDDEEMQEDFHDSAIEDEEPLEDIPRGNATSRLAVIGLDWSVTRAVDILASLSCFCPTGKKISYVEVHPSKFGLERLEVEAKLGPLVVPEDDLRVVQDAKITSPLKKPGHHIDSQPDDEEESDSDKPSPDIAENDTGSEFESENHFTFEVDAETREQERKEQAALRKYEQDRLKYYYGVVKCEDVKTADALYEQCDGVEYGQTGQAFDLRFIPDEMEITTKARDRAERLPDDYKPPVVNLSSLNNSTVKLSWDADDPDRVVLKKKAFGKHELNEQDLKAYLASSSEDEEESNGMTKENDEQKRNLLLSAINGDDDDEEAGVEVSFEPGMLEMGEEILQRKLEKDELKDETPWEGRMRRMRERKQDKWRERRAVLEMRANQVEGSGEDLSNNDSYSSDHSGADPLKSIGKDLEAKSKSKNSSKSGKRHLELAAGNKDGISEDEAIKQRQRAELELLVMDDRRANNTTVRDHLVEADSDEEEMRRKKKGKRTRGKRRWQKEDECKGKVSDMSHMDTDDVRFQGVFDSHLFAIDPTHPKYRDDETTKKIMKEKGRRLNKRQQNSGAQGGHDAKVGVTQDYEKQNGDAQNSVGTAQAELRQLAARVKARAKSRKGRNNR